MAIKSYKPTSAARRQMTVTDYSELSKVAPEKSLLQSLKKTAGRNNTGRITVRHHGGGNKQKYRVIDFKRDKEGKATATNTASLILRGTGRRTPRSSPWNMIPTAPHTSPWCSTPTARSGISSPPWA